MPTYILRFEAESCVRVNKKSYIDGPVHCIQLEFDTVTVVLFDRVIEVSNIRVPSGFFIQLSLNSPSIEDAIASAGPIAAGALNLFSFVSGTSIALPSLTFAYDASDGVEERDYISLTLDRQSPTLTRPLPDFEFGEFWTKYERFHSDQTISNDHKERVMRAVDAYRRGIADNDDSLTEFIVFWSSLEGMDCVYRKVFPSRQSAFKDGMRHVFEVLGHADKFTELETLRNEIAHGNLKLLAATQKAISNLNLVRNALHFMVLRIIGCDQGVKAKIMAQKPYKGMVVTNLKFVAKVSCTPGDVKKLNGHPEFNPILGNLTVVPNGDKIDITPEWDYKYSNIEKFCITKVELRGDPGVSVLVSGIGVVVIPSATAPKRFT